MPRLRADAGRHSAQHHRRAAGAARGDRLRQGRQHAHVRQGLLRRQRHRRRPGARRRGDRLRPAVRGPRPHHAVPVRRRRGQPGPGVRGVQHGQAVEPADSLRLRECVTSFALVRRSDKETCADHAVRQQVRHGHGRGPRLGPDRLLQARAVHPGAQGQRHGRAGGQGGGAARQALQPGGPGPAGARVRDVPLRRPLHVGPGHHVPHARGDPAHALHQRPHRRPQAEAARLGGHQRGGAQGPRQGRPRLRRRRGRRGREDGRARAHPEDPVRGHLRARQRAGLAAGADAGRELLLLGSSFWRMEREFAGSVDCPISLALQRIRRGRAQPAQPVVPTPNALASEPE